MTDFDAGNATPEDIEAIGQAVVDLIQREQAKGRRVEAVKVERGKLDFQRWIVRTDSSYLGGLGGACIWIPGVGSSALDQVRAHLEDYQAGRVAHVDVNGLLALIRGAS